MPESENNGQQRGWFRAHFWSTIVPTVLAVVVGWLLGQIGDLLGPSVRSAGVWLKWLLFGSIVVSPWQYYLFGAVAGIAVLWLVVRLFGAIAYGIASRRRPEVPPVRSPYDSGVYWRDVFELGGAVAPIILEWRWRGDQPEVHRILCGTHRWPAWQALGMGTRVNPCPHCNVAIREMDLQNAADRLPSYIVQRAENGEWTNAEQRVEALSDSRAAAPGTT